MKVLAPCLSLLPPLSLLSEQAEAFASSNEGVTCDDARPELEVCRGFLEFYSPSVVIPSYDDDGQGTQVPVYEGGWHWWYRFVTNNSTNEDKTPLGPTVDVDLEDDEETCTIKIGGALCSSCVLQELGGWGYDAQQATFSADCSNLSGNGYVGKFVEAETTLPFFYPLDLVDTTYGPETGAPTSSPAPTVEPFTLAPTESPYDDEAFCEDIEDQYYTCNSLYGGNQCADSCRPYLPDGIGILAFSVPYIVSQWDTRWMNETEQLQRAQEYMQDVCDTVPSRTCAWDVCCSQCSDLFRKFAQCRYEGFLQDWEQELNLAEGEMVDSTPCEIVSYECSRNDTLIPPPTLMPSVDATMDDLMTLSPTEGPDPSIDETLCETIQEQYIDCETQHGPDCYANPAECPVVIPLDVTTLFADNIEFLVSGWPQDGTRLERAQDYLEETCDAVLSVTCAFYICCPICAGLLRHYLQCRFLEYLQDFETALNREVPSQCNIASYDCSADDVSNATDVRSTTRTMGFNKRSGKTATLNVALTLRFGFEPGQGTEPDGDALAVLVANTIAFFQNEFLKDASFGGSIVGFSMPIKDMEESYSDNVLEVDMTAQIEINVNAASSSIKSHQAADVFGKANLNKYVRAVRQNGPRTALFHIHNVHVKAVTKEDADLS